MKNNKILKVIVIGLVVVLYFVSMKMLTHNTSEQPTNSKMTTVEFSNQIKNKDFISSIKEVQVDEKSDFITVIKKDGSTIKVPNPDIEGYKKDLLNDNITVSDKTKSDNGGFLFFGNLLSIVSFVLPILLMIFIFRFFMKGMGGAGGHVLPTDNFKFKFVVPSTTFKNVAGNKEAIDNLKDYLDFIKNPTKYEKLGARVPKGILMYGPSGTGKTLLAKALAGESRINFISTSGSEFVEKYVGVGAGRVRELFDIARKNTPCIIFIDEIDALCKSRGTSNNDEKDQTLNQLLVEMDGVIGNQNIIVIGATNRYDYLDDAVLRPGRFDRHIEVGLPDKQDRLEILKLHAKNKPLSADVDLEQVAKITTFMSGAELENVLNEASIFCAKNNESYVTMEHLNRAISKVVAGDEKQNKEDSASTLELVAYHEAGHALVAKLQKREVPKVTIIPTTKGAGGYTLITPLPDMIERKNDILKGIQIDFGGRIAEQIKYGIECISGGASQDLKNAKSHLEKMIKNYGLGKRLIAQELENKELYEEMNKIAEEEYAKTLELVTNHKEKLELIAQALLKKETIYEEELDAIMTGVPVINDEIIVRERVTKVLTNPTTSTTTM